MIFTPVERAPSRLADIVYKEIFSAIVNGDLKPGERLVQESIGEQMDVSRTPVRDALLRLESEGVLEASGRGGFLVRSFDTTEIKNIYGLRAAVEGYAAGLAAVAGRQDMLTQVAEILDDAGGDDITIDQGYDLNRRFHRSIVEAADNELLLSTFDSVWGLSQSLRLFAQLNNPQAERLNVEPGHDEILAVISSGDQAQARQIMEDHVNAGLQLQLDSLDTAQA